MLVMYGRRRVGKTTLISHFAGNFFTSSGYLYEEPSNLLKQELREPIKYNRIIEAIAHGASRLNEIATKSGLDTAAAANYTSTLIALGIIQKETAITEEKNKRKTLYRIRDSMFLFWYRYVQGNDFAIVTGDMDSLYETEIKPDLNRFMGYIFETICAEYLGVINGKDGLPFKIRELGRWWGSNPLTKTEEEIDLVGINPKLSSALFYECKYKEQMADSGVLQALKTKADLWRGYEHKYYMLFLKRGFTKELRAEVARQANVYLVSLADMYQ
ncbi:MAG: ATP-binding protein [Treponema sp.]|nr:ATP-binding protein [Treponema sp.]